MIRAISGSCGLSKGVDALAACQTLGEGASLVFAGRRGRTTRTASIVRGVVGGLNGTSWRQEAGEELTPGRTARARFPVRAVRARCAGPSCSAPCVPMGRGGVGCANLDTLRPCRDERLAMIANQRDQTFQIAWESRAGRAGSDHCRLLQVRIRLGIGQSGAPGSKSGHGAGVTGRFSRLSSGGLFRRSRDVQPRTIRTRGNDTVAGNAPHLPGAVDVVVVGRPPASLRK